MSESIEEFGAAPPGSFKVLVRDATAQQVAGADNAADAFILAGAYFTKTGHAVDVVDNTNAHIGGIGVAQYVPKPP
jgi:hypothetical protein